MTKFLLIGWFFVLNALIYIPIWTQGFSNIWGKSLNVLISRKLKIQGVETDDLLFHDSRKVQGGFPSSKELNILNRIIHKSRSISDDIDSTSEITSDTGHYDKDISLQQYSKQKVRKILQKSATFVLGSLTPFIANNKPVFSSTDTQSLSSEDIADIINNLHSDERLVTFNSTSLGLGLTEIDSQNQKRIIVNRINPDVLNPYLQSLVSKGMVIVAVNGENIEGMTLKDFSQYIATFLRPLYITLRDPNRFFQLLRQRNQKYRNISTLIRPNNRYTKQSEEVLTVEMLLNPEIKPEQLFNLTTAKKGDVIEILYQIQILTNKDLKKGLDHLTERDFKAIDGLKNHTMLEPGYANVKRLYDESLFLLLGSTKRDDRYTSFKNNNIENDFDGGLLNYLPLKWDDLLTGMAVGDERKLYLPSSYYKQKQFASLIQNNQLVIDVKMMSINGISQ